MKLREAACRREYQKESVPHISIFQSSSCHDFVPRIWFGLQFGTKTWSSPNFTKCINKNQVKWNINQTYTLKTTILWTCPRYRTKALCWVQTNDAARRGHSQVAREDLNHKSQVYILTPTSVRIMWKDPDKFSTLCDVWYWTIITGRLEQGVDHEWTSFCLEFFSVSIQQLVLKFFEQNSSEAPTRTPILSHRNMSSEHVKRLTLAAKICSKQSTMLQGLAHTWYIPTWIFLKLSCIL